MTTARAFAAVVLLAAVHALPAWLAVFLLALAFAACAVLLWWLVWRVMFCRRGWVLSWFTEGVNVPARSPGLV